MVVFEAEPPLAREPLHPEGLVPGLVSVDEDERARGEKRHDRERDRSRQAGPLLPAGNHERDEQEDARILEAHCQAHGEPG